MRSRTLAGALEAHNSTKRAAEQTTQWLEKAKEEFAQELCKAREDLRRETLARASMETVQADKIKELTLSVRLRSLVCVNANVLSWEFPFRRSKTTRHECHSDEAVWAETVAQRLNPRRGRHVVP